MARRMPIGIQTFEDIIEGGYAYADKTALAHRLANEGKFFFLSRPRRFGKSLLLSTLASYFDGRRDLFRGLAVERLEKDWARHPVLHIDLNVRAYRNAEDLDIGLDTNLRMYEEKWEITPGRVDAAARFFDLIQHAYRKTGQKAVVLIDEYDRPLIQTMERGIPNDDMRAALKGFYGVLKSADQWLRFVMLTGVTKFSKVSVFSDLNMLEDISMSDEYACLCGISARELEACFGPELESLAEKNGMTYGEAVAEMKKNYDGYHFSKDSEAVFNPFSALRALKSKEFSFYWFRTGTPTFLIDALKEARYDLMGLAEGVKIPEESIDDYRTDGGNLAPLLYQSGYLTICGYGDGMYSLAFPNAEVRCGFLQELLRYCTQGLPVQEFYVGLFMGDLRSGDVDAFMERMRALIAKIPYEFGGGKERQCQFIFYLLFTLLGQLTQAEVHSAGGRADAVVFTADRVYVFEFKLSGTAEDALRQIDDRGYAIPYSAGGREVVKIGVELGRDSRNVSRWLTRRT